MEEVSRRVAMALVALLALSLPASAAEKEAVLLAGLRTRVEAILRGLDGVGAVSVRDLRSGFALDVLASEPFPAASTIKLAVLYELYLQAEDGALRLDEVTTPPLPRVGGGGALMLLGPKVSLTWRDLAVLMMAYSDNEATNQLIAKVGQDAVNRRLDGLGLRQTRLRRRMMDLEAARRGEENVSTAGELVRLMLALREGRGLSPERAKDLLAVAAVDKDSPFRTGVPEGVTVIDKPGSLEGVRCVAALVPLPRRPYAVAIMTGYLRRDEDGALAIKAISAALYETFDRLDRSSDLGRVISGR